MWILGPSMWWHHWYLQWDGCLPDRSAVPLREYWWPIHGTTYTDTQEWGHLHTHREQWVSWTLRWGSCLGCSYIKIAPFESGELLLRDDTPTLFAAHCTAIYFSQPENSGTQLHIFCSEQRQHSGFRGRKGRDGQWSQWMELLKSKGKMSNSGETAKRERLEVEQAEKR